jgi:hypothetical protein
MGCASPQNNTWDSTVDFHVVYTGLTVDVAGFRIRQNDNYQSVTQALINAVNYVDNKEYYTPYIKVDNSLLFTMTGEEVETKHPDAPLGAIVYNDVDGFEFTKLAVNVWKFQIIEIR